MLFREGAPEHLRSRARRRRTGEIALPVGIANTLRLRLGDTVTSSGRTTKPSTLRVSGTFELARPRRSLLVRRPQPVPGARFDRARAALVERDTYLDAAVTLSLTSEFTWDAFLALDGLTFEEAARVPGELVAIEDAVQEDTRAARRHGSSSGLGTLFDLVDQRVKNLRVPILLVVFQIGAVTLAVLAGVGALTLTRQTFELAVLHSRGFTRGRCSPHRELQALPTPPSPIPLACCWGWCSPSSPAARTASSSPGWCSRPRFNAGAELLGLAGGGRGAAMLARPSCPPSSAP